MINYCKVCVNPSTKPGLSFNNAGVCPACIYEIEKKEGRIDWQERQKEIHAIKEWGRENSKSTYDCIVTVSGGKDSHRQAFFARDDLGMNPLLVAMTHPPEHARERGRANLSNLISHGFNCLTLSPDPIRWKALMRHSFLEFGNWNRSVEMALFASPVLLAIAYQIPLMFYGENPLHTIGEKHGRVDGNAIGIQEGNTIKGGVDSLNYTNVSSSDFHFYDYPTYEEMARANLRIVYLGYYIEDWYGYINGQNAIRQGLLTRTDGPEKTGDLWGFSGVDEDYRLVNQYVKYLKYGYGHVTDQVCEAIHQGMMNRQEAIDLVRQYDGKVDFSYINDFCKYIGISLREFDKTVANFVDKQLFHYDGNSWIPNFEVH